MTTNPRTGKAVCPLPDIPGKMRVGEIYTQIPEFTPDQVFYWIDRFFSPDEKVGGNNYYDESIVQHLRYMGALIKHLGMTPSTAQRLAKKMIEHGTVSRHRRWIQINGVQLGIPLQEIET